MPLTLEVVSLKPRVFIIENFLSDFEVEEIIRIAIPLQGGSQVGNVDGGGVRKSETRTSKNSWIKRRVEFFILFMWFIIIIVYYLLLFPDVKYCFLIIIGNEYFDTCRSTNQVTESISLRAADLLQLDEKILTPGYAEDMQVIRSFNLFKYSSVLLQQYWLVC